MQGSINYSLGTFPEIIDYSTLSKLSTCRRQGFWGSIRALQVDTNIHLHAGGAYAEGLKALRNAFYVEKLSQDAALRKAFIALTKKYGDFNPGDQAKSWINMIHSLLAYTRYYPLETDLYKPYESGGKHFIEFSFAIPLPVKPPTTGNPIIFAGRADMICTDGSSLMLADDKTTGQMREKWPEKWQMRAQFPGYLWAAEQYGHHCHGVLVRGVSIQKTQTKHLQVPVHFARWQIDRWYEDMIQRLQHYIWCFQNNFWPVDGEFNEACTAYSGCPYKILCTSPDPETWVPGRFVVHRWNPLEGDLPDGV